MEDYLKEFHEEDITDLLNNSDDAVHVSIKLSLSHLQTVKPILYEKILRNPHDESKLWNESLLSCQKKLVEGNMFLEDGYQIKENCYVRFVNLPGDLSDITFPNNDQIGKFVQIKGNVVRITQTRLLEIKREYTCSKCKNTEIVSAEYNRLYVIEPPKFCKNSSTGCKGILYPTQSLPKPEFCIDYQEIRIQELLSEKNIPSSIIITLENDLSDSCQPGDSITVCGTVERRWKPLHAGKKSEVTITLRAISVCREETKPQIGRDLPEQLLCVRAQWQETIERIGEENARDLILKSICPEIHGMYFAKLAVALSLCSAVDASSAALNSRTNSHLLLVGDPGLAKSKLIKFASKIAYRSVYTTGMGCSQAGLTAAAVRDGGEWQLEAGALVLADGGICCIDEFNMMRESDKASIHEAMEQQTVSMAKAGIVCKLSTRCAILAATNHKNLHSISEREDTSYINIGIASPLLSRFDLVLILRDIKDIDWDIKVAEHILQKIDQNSSNCDDILTIENLQSHFLAARSINPEITPVANRVLESYYKFCRTDVRRDPGRTTARLLDCLIRLSQSHARLLFRSKITIYDTIVVIKLMESSWGFGRLINGIEILKTEPPLGPDECEIQEILKLLNIELTAEELKDCQNERNNISKTSSQLLTEEIVISNKKNFDQNKKNHSNNLKKSKRSFLFNDTEDFDKLDSILSLEDHSPTHKNPKKICNENVSPNIVDIENEYGFKVKKIVLNQTQNEILSQNKLTDTQTIVQISSQASEKNLQLSSTKEIDLDEIFADDDSDEEQMKEINNPVENEKIIKVSNKTLDKLKMFSHNDDTDMEKEVGGESNADPKNLRNFIFGDDTDFENINFDI